MKIKLRYLLTVAAVAFAGVVHAQAVVVVGASSPAGNMTKEQVADIFSGRSTEFEPVDQVGGAIRDEFSSKVLGKSTTQMKAFWAKAAFTGKGNPPKELGGSADVKQAVAANPKRVGYIEKSAVDGTVKVILSP
ncbi:MAG: hypothetical protein IH605_11845 [Burkholderiales bacterium]|nr:hypothetical protein [Burkholderiales bacterium]